MNTDLWRNHLFPSDHWLRMVGENFLLKQGDGTMVWMTSKLHAIKKNGRLACKCDFPPPNSAVYKAERVAPEHRHLLCRESIEYLQRLVTKENQTR